MIITVKKIDVAPQPESNSGLNTYRVEFESETVSGQALLYSRVSAQRLLSGVGSALKPASALATIFDYYRNLATRIRASLSRFPPLPITR